MTTEADILDMQRVNRIELIDKLIVDLRAERDRIEAERTDRTHDAARAIDLGLDRPSQPGELL